MGEAIDFLREAFGLLRVMHYPRLPDTLRLAAACCVGSVALILYVQGLDALFAHIPRLILAYRAARGLPPPGALPPA